MTRFWGIVLLLLATSDALAQDEPGGPRLGPIEREEPEAPKPAEPIDAKIAAPAEPVQYVRALVAFQMMMPMASRGGYLPITELDDAPGIALSVGYTPFAGFLVGARLDIGFGGVNSAAWNKILDTPGGSNIIIHSGPTVQFRARPLDDMLVYVGAEFVLSKMSHSGRTDRPVVLGEFAWPTGTNVEVDYFGVGGGATIGVAYFGITVEGRYVRNQWTTFDLSTASFQSTMSSDQLFLAVGYALSL